MDPGVPRPFWSIFLCCVFVCCAVGGVQGKNVLVFYPHDSISHLYSMAPYLERLVHAGHNLTVFSTGDKAVPPAMDFRASFVHARHHTEMDPELEKMFWLGECHGFMLVFVHLLEDVVMNAVLDNHSQNFVKILNADYDLVIVDELFTLPGMAMTRMLQRHRRTPYVSFATSASSPTVNNMAEARSINQALNPIVGTFIPNTQAELFDHRRFGHRVYNVLEMIAEVAGMQFKNVISPYSGPIRLGVDDLSTVEMTRQAKMQLTEGVERLGRIIPQGMESRPIGSHCKPKAELQGDLVKFVEDPASKGTIYIAFGSIANFDACPQFVFDALFGALDAFPEYRIVFSMKKLKNRTLPDPGRHVRFTEWAPQWALLNHPKTRVFMSHGGLKSFKESLCSETPAVFVPLFAEQLLNAQVAVQLGWATFLSKYNLSVGVVEDAFRRVLHDPVFQTNIRKAKTQYLDRVMDVLDEGVWFTEKFLRRTESFAAHGLEHTHARPLMAFERKGTELSLLEFFGFDWLLSLLAVLLALSYGS